MKKQPGFKTGVVKENVVIKWIRFFFSMNIIILPPYKSWFQGLGLHHASITLVAITLGHIIHPIIGVIAAAYWMGWYASREWGLDLYPPKSFEIMDFLSPAIVSIIYLVAFSGFFYV